MKSSLKHEQRKAHFFIAALLAANGLSLLLSIIYLVTNSSHGMWNLFGVLLLLTLVGNILVTLVGSNKKSLDIFYLVLTIVSMIIIPNANRAVSSDVTNTSSQSVLSIILLFYLLFLGGMITFQKLHDLSLSKGHTKKQRANTFPHTRSVMRFIILIFLSFILLIGVYLACQLVVGKGMNIVELAFPQHSLFFSFIFLSIAALILKISSYRAKSFVKILVFSTGIVLSITFSLPLLIMPFSSQNAASIYMEAFGEDPKELIPVEEQNYFLSTPFMLQDYFFGIASGDYRVQQDVLYYEGRTGVDTGILLHFDVYMPPADQADLPGNHSVLVRIHGGGWTAGDKGSSNNAQVNKYFASQGYVVFDVQYGLSHEDKLFALSKVPENIVGGFTIDDMVRHLGIFTDYLVEHGGEYEANLDSVFISGGSAGGQLAIAVGLGLAGGQIDYLNPRLNVKGIIPVYPANGLSKIVEVEGSEELTDPSFFVTEDSPPALIYQGTHDGVVNQSVAIKFDQTYKERGSSNSALILMPFAGHSSNLYFPGYYNQVFLYYMERFMYQFK
ncbi:alpha/beta hydrolase [Oceanobacillus saliphilus]|uniref:alpha/beta hydrolase n=1 Tax=Oceanobacillus saliphilus TaxID=2925834 RepID=UPI00201DB751|nr:alpha/beta hydrolase [Oceanobacillus saliphilus]